jgi:hypothetical protein
MAKRIPGRVREGGGRRRRWKVEGGRGEEGGE